MGFSVNTNLDALNTYKNLSGVQNSLSKSLEKLSSGLRINNAGDDAAGLTIATQLGSQVSGLAQASRNAQDGVSVVQTADGALTQTQSLLGRLRDLAVQAGNDSNSPTARAAIATEAGSISDELTRLSTSVDFNGQKLLDGSTSNMKFQVGANGDAASRITVDLSGANLSKIGAAVSAKAQGSVISDSANGAAFLAAVRGAATTNVTFSSATAATATSAASTSTFTLDAALTDSKGVAVPSTASDTDVVNALNANAKFSSAFRAVVQYTTTAGVTSVSGIGVIAKDGGTVDVTTPGASSSTTHYGSMSTDTVPVAKNTDVNALDFTTSDGAQSAINAIDAQLAKVSTARANIGALENRFASAQSTIATSITNLTAAKSRITDVDMASEMVNYSRANILSQSGTAMLAQANSLPQLALKLLG